MKGGNYNMFNPKQYVTRGEAVNVLYRIMTGVKVTNQSQDGLEAKAFKDIKDVYGSVKSFANDGIMYWQGDKLHIGVKDAKNRQKLADAIADDKDIPAESVYVQKSTYSYNDYKNLMLRPKRFIRRRNRPMRQSRRHRITSMKKLSSLFRPFRKKRRTISIKRWGVPFVSSFSKLGGLSW